MLDSTIARPTIEGAPLLLDRQVLLTPSSINGS
jgi:hypothetical protein